jgi:predicted mannosyl-3-phosphoglycerate phosphatase (HAD superfamily)
VFADIDGVLSTMPLPALAQELGALERLGAGGAFVLCSGKTRPEIESLAYELGLNHPFICEYGAGVVVPTGYFPFRAPDAVSIAGSQVVALGRPATWVADLLRRTAHRQGVEIRTFSEMSVDEVAQECGLSPSRARLAKLRDYGEMFSLRDPNPSARIRMLEALGNAHLRVVPRQRHIHVGAPVDFSVGIKMLRAMYHRNSPTAVTVGIADWQADGHVLSHVDYPIVVAGRGGESVPGPRRTPRQVRTIRLLGDTTWVDAIVTIVGERHPVDARVAAR